MQDSMAAWFVAVAAVLLGGCSSSPSDTPADSGGTAGSAAVNTSYAPCKGTLSGAASGAFTCDAHAVFFLPGYANAELRGKSEVTMISSTKFDAGMSPPGIASISWAGIFAGAMAPGSYTEQQLLQSNLSAAALSFDDNSQISGIKRLKLDIAKISDGSVYSGARDDDASGTLELVLGDDTQEVVISATFQ